MMVANVLSITEHKWFSQTFSAPLYLACMIVLKTDVIIEIQITVIQRDGWVWLEVSVNDNQYL